MKKALLLGSLLSIATSVAYAEEPAPKNEEPLLFQTPSFLRELFAILGSDPATPCYFKPDWPSQIVPGHKVPILICEVPGFKLGQPPGTSQAPSEEPQKAPEDQPPPIPPTSHPNKAPAKSDNFPV